ncbi:hypothetical protein N7539_007712 [Penicillium diatomitis]|uniref:Uncharacterized protein n=1 Tax=Penicillium diatomitis TaxID=2819901 RepID=A0A9W9WTV2_9EURO|nr:uncharacterized protein N7539_007712 [Penicillium diatomitis]KAJ5475425.1 hypothetical protein N7539_007712 [Penicillium diatomitis]
MALARYIIRDRVVDPRGETPLLVPIAVTGTGTGTDLDLDLDLADVRVLHLPDTDGWNTDRSM